MSPPELRSITVSAPKLTDTWSLHSSVSMSDESAELPMLALIFTLATLPMPMGLSPL